VTPPPEPPRGPPGEPAEARLKRLRLRSWRRGTREMDLILGPFADAELAALPPPALEAYDDLLSENDQDLYAWISRAGDRPRHHVAIVARIAAFHGID
jgi:antitoxin CptB